MLVVTMRYLCFISLLGLCWCCTSAPTPTIVLDGTFEDWDAVSTVLQDPPDDGAAEMDFAAVKASYDDEWVYFHVDMGHPNDLSYLDGTAYLLLDLDGKPETGQLQYGFAGVDARIQFSAFNPFARVKRGLALYVAPTGLDSLERRSFYDLHFEKIPSYASSAYEMRLRRGVALEGVPVAFADPSFGFKLVYEGPDGTVQDETDMARVAFDDLVPSTYPTPDFSRIEKEPNTIRLALLNASVRRIFQDREAYQRIVKALDPDIIAITEVLPDTAKDVFQAYFAETLGGTPDSWNVAYPDPGGFLKRPIISQYPFDPVPAFEGRPHAPEMRQVLADAGYPEVNRFLEGYISRGMPVTGKVVTIAGQRLLVLALGLRFAGGAEGPEEVIRQVEAQEINTVIKELIASGRIDGVLAATDLNLYGTEQPLLNMKAGADFDQTDLAVPPVLHLDGKSRFTWFSPFKDTFPPAVLDHILYSDATIQMVDAFLFDTVLLPQAVLDQYGLQATDLEASMDHYPLVFDFQFHE